MKNLLLSLIIITLYSCGETTRETTILDYHETEYDFENKKYITYYKGTPFSGTIIKKQIYDSDGGEIEFIKNYKDGKYHGLYERYYDNGKLFEKSTYKDGKWDGLKEVYWSSGQLNTKSNFKNGKQEGPYEKYYYSGKLFVKTNYKDGKQEGPYEKYYEDGKLEEKSTYKDGRIVN